MKNNEAGSCSTGPNSDSEAGSIIDGTLLDRLPETALWILWSRATESARTDSSFSDPMAEQLHRSIRFPYENFGRPSQSQALRGMTFDGELRRFLDHSPNATVVALGEGLQTTYWRLGSPATSWLSLDLPEMIAIRERLLPRETHVRHAALSALDRSWFDLVTTDDVIITAEGLLMYLPQDDVFALIADLAKRFPGASIVFDAIPPALSELTRRGTRVTRSTSYKVPHMPFGLTVADARRLPKLIPGVAAYEELPLVPGRGLLCNPTFLRAQRNTPLFGNHRHFIAKLTFVRDES